MRVRGFTLAEIMVVVVVIGVASAVAVPGIVTMVKASQGEQAVVESSSVLAAARDSARGRGVCLDYVLQNATSVAGSDIPPRATHVAPPYAVRIYLADCPGEPTLPVGTNRLMLDRKVSQLVTNVTLVVDAAETDRLHFNRDGGLISPACDALLTAEVSSLVRKFRIFPAAGTIEEL